MNTNKKILLIGGGGTLGSTIIRSKIFKNLDFPSKKNLNLLYKSSIRKFINRKYDLIINCAAFARMKECEKYDLRKKTVGILGLSFKAENDDIRDSLSIKLLNYLKSKKIRTLQSDEYYKDKNNIDKNLLVKKSDIIIVSTPHKAYKNLKINKKKVLIDIWGFVEKK